jgi:hypothetical protein
MSERAIERRKSVHILEKFTEQVMVQNESTSRLNLEQSVTTNSTLDRMAKTIDKLADSQTELTSALIETRKDREFDQRRIGKLEEYNKNNDERFEKINNTMILLEERTSVNTSKWMAAGGFVVMIIGVVAVSYIKGITPA